MSDQIPVYRPRPVEHRGEPPHQGSGGSRPITLTTDHQLLIEIRDELRNLNALIRTIGIAARTGG